MLKKVLAVLICMMMILPIAAFAQKEVPSDLGIPKNLSVRDDNGIIYMRWADTDRAMQIMDDGAADLLYQVDWKINNGSWKFGEKPVINSRGGGC